MTATKPKQPPNIGFIGIGRMGAGMASNILESGYRLTVQCIGVVSAWRR